MTGESSEQQRRDNTPAVVLSSEYGEDDPQIHKPYFFAKKVVEHLNMDETTKYEVDFFADRLKDKLESSLMYYQMLAADSFDRESTSRQKTIYEGLYANLWSFYKGRVQNLVREMGWNLAIFFCKEENFEKEAAKFLSDNPGHEDLVNMARKQREAWQTDFATNRNIAEHSGDFRNGENTYETKSDGQRLFAQVCWTAETIIAYCGSYKMDENWNVIENSSNINVFMHEERYTVEHAVTTARRDSQQSL